MEGTHFDLGYQLPEPANFKLEQTTIMPLTRELPPEQLDLVCLPPFLSSYTPCITRYENPTMKLVIGSRNELT